MIDFVEHVPINDIQKSEYNPRVITPEALVSLQESLRRFGMVKPLIVNNANNVIVAGHQRKKAALSIGMTDLPCVWIRAPNAQDEIHFNMLHNSIETSQNSVRIEEFKVGRYCYCPSAKIKVESEPKNVLICSEITRLLSQYGEWGSVVTDGNGVVLLNAEYAYCAKKMGYGVLAYAIPNDDVEEFLRYINIEYGKYNFDNIPIKTYHQFKAQLRRRSTDGRRLNVSNLYEKYLIPNLQKINHIIDVGAGRMAYMKYVKSMGYDIHAYEPSLMTRGANHLDMKGITAHARNGEIITGSMTNHGAVNGVIDSLAGYTIPAGYHDGSGTVTIDGAEQDNIIPENIKSGVSILGVQGSLSLPTLTPVTPNATNITHFWLPKTLTHPYCNITYEAKTNTRSDEYAVEAGKLYLARFLEPYGAWCEAAFSEVSLVGRTSSVSNCPVLAPVYRHEDIYFVAPMNGYLIMYKDDKNNDSFLTECFEVTL